MRDLVVDAWHRQALRRLDILPCKRGIVRHHTSTVYSLGERRAIGYRRQIAQRCQRGVGRTSRIVGITGHVDDCRVVLFEIVVAYLSLTGHQLDDEQAVGDVEEGRRDRRSGC